MLRIPPRVGLGVVVRKLPLAILLASAMGIDTRGSYRSDRPLAFEKNLPLDSSLPQRPKRTDKPWKRGKKR